MAMGLPSLGGRGGNFEIDAEYKKKITRDLNKLDELDAIASMDAKKP